MSKSILVVAGAVILGALSVGSDVKAQSCTQLAHDTGRALARQYCEIIKDADVDRLVIKPRTYPGPIFLAPSLTVPPACTRADRLICKQRMADIVGEDEYCLRLYHEGFAFTFRDEFTGEQQQTDSRSFYGNLQLDGCRLR